MIRTPETLTGLRDIARDFDTFLVDQFGVLHDGTTAYPGTIEAMSELKDSGATIILISNSGKRSRPNAARMERLGFKPGSWDHFLTSGEVAWNMLAQSLRGQPSQKCLLLARDGDRSAIDGLPLEITDDGASCDVVLLAASEGDRHDMDHYRKLLAPAAARAVPCLCTNPDKIMLTTVGPRFGAGAIADEYARLGGPVTWIGKPFPEIYQAARQLAGAGARIACVGDSIEHDIAGGRHAGLATVLVATGILADMNEDQRAALFVEHGAVPDFMLPAFRW